MPLFCNEHCLFCCNHLHNNPRCIPSFISSTSKILQKYHGFFCPFSDQYIINMISVYLISIMTPRNEMCQAILRIIKPKLNPYAKHRALLFVGYHVLWFLCAEATPRKSSPIITISYQLDECYQDSFTLSGYWNKLSVNGMKVNLVEEA